MLPTSPPRTLIYSVSKGDTGWPVYAAQCALNSVRVALGASWDWLVTDGDFGALTETVVRRFQTATGITVDGKFGPGSTLQAIRLLDARVHTNQPSVPQGLIRGFAEGEGGNCFAAVNWSIPGGVDCGLMQYRVPGPPYETTLLRNDFNPFLSMMRAGSDFLTRVDHFIDAPGVINRSDRVEFAKRLAILAHNWPAGADDIAKDGVLTNPSGVASWVPEGVKFPDGTPVVTRLQWAQFYALGGPHGEAMIPKYVTDWT